MKTSIKYFQLIIVALMLYLTSCTDDGDAVSDPTKDNRDDYVGLWSVSEDSKIFGPSVYESEIIKNTSNSSNVAIDNFYQLGIEIVTQATVNGNQLFIPQQTITQKNTIRNRKIN